METLTASLVAVLGTLLGAGLTHRFQVRAAERAERFTREERLRQERMAAYSAYAGALVTYRRVLLNRWFRLHEDDEPEEAHRARLEGYAQRTTVQEALFRVQMLTPDEALVARAREALELTDQLHRAPDRAELERRRDITRAAVTAFVTEAGRTL
ncbi:hypothetical protein ACSCBZ_44110 [Streptomyces niveiscabiei]|nr:MULTISPECIES: hypothetical protein [Streptomyces]QZZ28482.1 hypothetical protein A7X85_21330 [Streptomyces sp. ST1015]